MWSADPFTYATKGQGAPNRMISNILTGAFSAEGDHAEVLGFNLLNFEQMAPKLDALNETGDFKGFSPRWTLPIKLRNPEETGTNTSALLLIIDSARENDLKLTPYFSQ
jgi:hypothetical protein